MLHQPHRAALCLTAALAALIAAPLVAGPPAGEPIKDRSGFIPRTKHQALPGKVVGVLAYDAQPVLSTEGRSGPADQLCFGMSGSSYRWVYVQTPGAAPPVITNLQVAVGGQGAKKIYPALDIARPTNVKHFGVTQKYSLVEVEVNDGLGSPAEQSFVATNIKVLDGSANFPIKVTETIDDLKKRYAEHVGRQKDAIDRELGEAAKKAVKDRKITGPRTQEELMFVTWLPESQRLRVHFRTKVSDGAYETVKGPGPVPVPPRQKFKQPPPRDFMVKVGTTFGVEFGMAYEVGRDGRLVATQLLPFETFQFEVRQGVGGPRNPPLPLPPPPAK
jgi:hypothetical protein